MSDSISVSLASPSVFAILVGASIVGAAIAAIVLIILFFCDWRSRRLW